MMQHTIGVSSLVSLVKQRDIRQLTDQIDLPAALTSLEWRKRGGDEEAIFTQCKLHSKKFRTVPSDKGLKKSQVQLHEFQPGRCCLNR